MTKRKATAQTNKSKKIRGNARSARSKRGGIDGILLDIVRMFDRTYGPPPGRKSF